MCNPSGCCCSVRCFVICALQITAETGVAFSEENQLCDRITLHADPTGSFLTPYSFGSGKSLRMCRFLRNVCFTVCKLWVYSQLFQLLLEREVSLRYDPEK